MLHPDKNKDDRERAEMAFKKLSEAYDVLSDQKKRDVHDRSALLRNNAVSLSEKSVVCGKSHSARCLCQGIGHESD